MIPDDGAGHSGETKASFVDRGTYRRRRLMDIAKVLPIFGAFLFIVPFLRPEPDGPDEAATLSSSFVYLFGVWLSLIVLSFVFGGAVRRWASHWTKEPPRGGREAQDR